MEISMPKYVDSQPQVLWWESDEFVITCTILGVGLIVHAIVIPMVLIIFVMPILAKMKRSALDGAVMHVLYSTGIVPLNNEFEDALETEFYQ